MRGDPGRRHVRAPGEAVGEEGDLPVGELLGQVLQLVADVQVDVVQLDLDEPPEGHAGRGVRDAVAQLDRAGPVGGHRARGLEAGRALA